LYIEIDKRLSSTMPDFIDLISGVFPIAAQY